MKLLNYIRFYLYKCKNLFIKKETNYFIKISFIGLSKCGITSLIQKQIYNKFDLNTFSTKDIDFRKCNIIVNNNKFKLYICDTSLNENYINKNIWDNYLNDNIHNIFLNDVQISVLVFDITNIQSFLKIPMLITNNTNIYKILVGTKSDLSDLRLISYKEAYLFAQSYDMLYIEVSAKTGHNISKLFEIILLDYLYFLYN